MALVTLKDAAEFCGYIAVIWSAFRATKRWVVPSAKKFFGGRHADLVMRVDTLHAKLVLIINLRGDAVYVCRPDGSNVWASDSLAKMFGLSPEQMHGNGWSTAIVEEDRVRSVRRWKECVATRTPYSDTYGIIVNGKRKTVETRAYEYCNENGAVVLYVGYVIEVKKNTRRLNQDNQDEI